MAKKTHSGEESNREIPPAKARPAILDSGNAVFDALAKLRGVRKPDKGKLGLREAIAAALEQGAAYDRWLITGTPIRRVQVWVEGRPVMTVSPDESSVNLKSVHFDVASPRDAVMQILKADEGEESVVLRNLPLGTVPATGLIDPISLPNGQRIILEVVPKEGGRFDVKVAFAMGEDTPISIEQPVAKKAKAKAVAAKRTSINHWPHPPAWVLNPLTGGGVWITASVVLIALGLAAIYPWNRLIADNNRKIVTTGKQNATAQAPRRKTLANRRGSSGGRVGSNVREKSDSDQQTAPPVSGEIEAQLPSSAESNNPGIVVSVDPSNVAGESVRGGTDDVKLAGQQTVETLNETFRAVGTKVGAEAVWPPSSYSQNRPAEPSNYSSSSSRYSGRQHSGTQTLKVGRSLAVY